MSRNPASLLNLKQTDTLAFRAWFGGSQVVNVFGDPLVVYHGTNADFSVFEVGEKGAFFSEKSVPANAYAIGDGEVNEGLVLPVYLSIQNPLVTTDEWLRKFNKTNQRAIKAARDEAGSNQPFRTAFIDSEVWARKLVAGEAKRLGHDGMILPKDLLPVSYLDGDWKEQVSFVAFSPHQIKSGIGNCGDFSPENPDICMSRVPSYRERAR
jgi:hypothetical protein